MKWSVLVDASRNAAFELIENALLAFVFAGVAWNVAAGHGLVPQAVVAAGIVLTTAFLFALFSVETIVRSGPTAIPVGRRAE